MTAAEMMKAARQHAAQIRGPLKKKMMREMRKEIERQLAGTKA